MTMVATSTACIALAKREFVLAVRNRSELVTPVLFMVMVATLFPLGLGPDPVQLRAVAPAVLWIAALLATLLGLNQLFASDYKDGTLEQLLLSPHPLAVVVSIKVLVHWFTVALPIALCTPIVGFAYGLPADSIGLALLTLLMGTPVLSFVGAIGVALTVGLRKGGTFLALLVLPLFIPVLIFATAAVTAQSSGLSATGSLFWLAALLIASLTLAPFAVATALRISMA